MTVTVEILKEEALAFLRSLEQLKVLKLIPTKSSRPQKAKPIAQKSEQGGDKPTFEVRTKADDIIKPLRKTITLDSLLKEQQFKGFDRAAIDELIKEINVQEPIEALLGMLKP